MHLRKRVLVTGGSGFLGSHLCARLLDEGHEVLCVDNFFSSARSNVEELMDNKRFELLRHDVTFPLFVEVDEIYNLACPASPVHYQHDPVQTIKTCVHGAINMLGLAKRLKARIFQASTSEVYGKSAKPFFQESDDLCIGASTNSRWSYACSKLLDEFLLMAFHRNRGLPGTVVRFFNTVGPRQTGRYGMVLPRFVSSALAGAPLKVYGTGEQTRCFCHVQDVIRALKLLIPAERSYGKVFNIGTTRRISIRQLAELVIERAKSSSEIRKVSYEDAYEPGFEDMMNRAPDCTAIKELCGWIPQIELEQIIDDVIAYTKSK